MTRQMRIETFSEVYIRDELKDNSNPAKLYEVVEESVDREGNYEYYLHEIDDDDAEIIGPYYPESLVDAEEAQHIETAQQPNSGFPSFKSYGLTREQVWEVMNNYSNYMIDLLHDLEHEAINDGNAEFAKSYSDDKQVFYELKLMSDRLWHRFVEADADEMPVSTIEQKTPEPNTDILLDHCFVNVYGGFDDVPLTHYSKEFLSKDEAKKEYDRIIDSLATTRQFTFGKNNQVSIDDVVMIVLMQNDKIIEHKMYATYATVETIYYIKNALENNW